MIRYQVVKAGSFLLIATNLMNLKMMEIDRSLVANRQIACFDDSIAQVG